MATIRQKKAARNLLKSTSRQEAMEKAGYSKSYSMTGQIKKTKSWEKLVDQYLPDELLAEVHNEGLQAKIKRFKNNVTTGEIEEVVVGPNYTVRHKYLDTAYKLKGSYAPEKKSIDLNLDDKDKEKSNKAIQDAITRGDTK